MNREPELIPRSEYFDPSGMRMHAVLQPIMERVAAMMAQVLEAEFCTVFVYDDDHSRTLGTFRHGHADAGIEPYTEMDHLPPMIVPIEADVIRRQSPIQRAEQADFETWPLSDTEAAIRKGLASEIVLPLVTDGRVQATAFVWRRTVQQRFPEEDVAAALEIAELGAIAIRFAREYEHERALRHRLDTLLGVANVVSAETDLDDILRSLAQAVRAGTDVDACFFYVFDEAGEQVFSEYQDGLTAEEESIFIDGRRLSLTVTPAMQQLRERLEPLVVSHFADELWLDHDALSKLGSLGISELLLLPIVYRDELIGVAFSWHRSPGKVFSDATISMAFAIAGQVGMVISRSRLREVTRQQTLESESLLRIGQAVLTSDSLDPVLDEIAETLRQMIPYDHCFVALLTADGSALRVIRDWGPIATGMRGQELPVDGSLTGAVVRTGEIVNVPDKFVDPRRKEFDPVQEPLRSVLIAPLMTERGTIGALYLGRQPAGMFPRHQERLISLLAQQVALAIERTQSREDLHARTERQAFLASVVEMLVAHDDPGDVLPDIARRMTRVIADGVLIGLASWEYGQIGWQAVTHRDADTERKLLDGLGILSSEALRERFENALVSQQVFVFGPERVWPEHAFFREFLEVLGVVHMIVAPLFRPERARGVLILINTQSGRRFQDEDVDLARIIAHRIGDSLERQHMTRNREALLRVAEAMHDQTGLEEILQTITVELDVLAPYETLLVVRPDYAAQVWRPMLFRSRVEFETAEWTIPFDQGICGEVYRTRQPVFDNEADARETSFYIDDADPFFRRQGESAMAAPLMAADELIGVIFHNRTGRHRLTTADFETFLLFAGLVASAIDHTELVQHNRQLYRASIEVLAAMVDAKDPYTLEHSRHVAHYSRIAAELMELTTEEVERIELAGLMHDIGKLGIPDTVLTKPGRLTDEERALINTHPDRGARILQQHPALTGLVPLVRHHHEWCDGRGYPSGLAGDDIPIGASIICVADAFDTMTSERTYQRRRSISDALAELERCAGTQFYPAVVARFASAIRSDPGLIYLSPVE